MRVLAWASLLLILVLLPTTTAQPLLGAPNAEMRSYAPDQPLLPEIGLAQVKLHLSVGCTADDLRGDVTRVIFHLRQVPAYANAVLDPASSSHSFSQVDCAANPNFRVTFVSRLSVSVTRDAPAFQDGLYEIEAIVMKPGGAGYGPYRTAFTIKNDYVSQVSIDAGPTIVAVRPNERFSLPLELTNLGNGPTKVGMEILPSTSSRLDAIRPSEDIILESRAGLGEAAQYRATSVIEGLAPAEAGQYGFVARIHSAYAGAGDGLQMTDETQVAYTIIVEDPEGESAEPEEDSSEEEPLGTAPGGALAWAALSLLGAALWRRR